MKIVVIVLPDLLYKAGDREIGKEDGTFYDLDKLMHIRINMRDFHLATGMHRNTIGKTLQQLHNRDVVSYRTFNEPRHGDYYRYSYLAALDNLWMGIIKSPQGLERNRGNEQKNYKPSCVKCYGTHQRKTGGIEYECLTCGNRHVYYPE
jgi:transcription initiation factor IIE alpha subunit